jgi:hypothetical protein
VNPIPTGQVTTPPDEAAVGRLRSRPFRAEPGHQPQLHPPWPPAPPGGADAAFDPVGGDYWLRSLKALTEAGILDGYGFFGW